MACSASSPKGLPSVWAPGGKVTSGQALLVTLLHGVVIGAVKIAAQQLVTRIALFLHQANHAAHRHTYQCQSVAGQHHGALNRFGHDFGGACGL